MLDTKASWDDLVRTHAPDAGTRDAILANPLYRNVTGKFVQSHDYIAMERLHEIHVFGPLRPHRGQYPRRETPSTFSTCRIAWPTSSSSWLLRWLIAPYRSRVFTAASKPFYSVADRVSNTVPTKR